MKKLSLVLILLFCIGVVNDGVAQMSKKEKKEWKKRIKKLEPEQYKSLLDENKSMKSEVANLRQQVGGVDSRIAEKDDQISQLQGQVDDMRTELSATKDELAKARSAAAQPQQQQQQVVDVSSKGSGINDQVGVVFKVQIGAFKNKDLEKYLDAGDNFSGEVDDQGLRRYSLGVFRDYWEADTFKKYLREMGVKDAWIVSFRDGKRVPIKEVLEGVSRK